MSQVTTSVASQFGNNLTSVALDIVPAVLSQDNQGVSISLFVILLLLLFVLFCFS